jgi:DNA-binding CsgD family transcriptional regulator
VQRIPENSAPPPSGGPPVASLTKQQLAAALQRVQQRRAADAAYEAELICGLADLTPDDTDPHPDSPGGRSGSWAPDTMLPGVSEFPSSTDLPALTVRELQVVQLLSRRQSTVQTATALSISGNTVRTRVHHAQRRLAADTRDEARHAARHRGLLWPSRAPGPARWSSTNRFSVPHRAG